MATEPKMPSVLTERKVKSQMGKSEIKAEVEEQGD